MKGRGLVIGLLLVIGLAVFAYLEVRRDSAQGVREENEFLFPYNARRVSELRVTLDDRSAHLKRDASGSWEVLEGEGIDLEYVGDFLSAWGQMRFIEVVAEEASEDDLERYALGPARMRASAVITTREGQEPPLRPPSIEVGGPLPLQVPGYYARVDGFERIVAVSPEAGGMFHGPGHQLFGLESNLQVSGSEDDHAGH